MGSSVHRNAEILSVNIAHPSVQLNKRESLCDMGLQNYRDKAIDERGVAKPC